MKQIWKETKSIASKAIDLFTRHDLTTFSAALSFYTVLSLAPLLIICLAFVSLIEKSNQVQFLNEVNNLLGAQAGDALKAIIQGVNAQPQMGTLAGILGIIALVFSASGVFAQLQSSLNIIFDAPAKDTTGIANWIRNRLLSVAMVASIGFFAIVSLVVSTVLSFLFTENNSYWSLTNGICSIAIFAFLFSILFKYLPDIRLKWKNALLGGLTTSILFTIGKSLIGIYLGRSAIGSAYGAAGSLIVLLAWVYYSSLIVFAGAELTYYFSDSGKTSSPLQQRPGLDKSVLAKPSQFADP